MSIAARRSHRGDEYQERIAVYWITRLLFEDDLAWVQSETMGSVDDVVVCHKDGSRLYIQAKKNQKDFREWSIPDLKSELLNACEQIEKRPSDKVIFYSRTHFGAIGKYLESAHCDFESYDSFVNNASETLKKTLSELAKAIGRDEKTTFELFLKVEIGGHHSFEEWEQLILDKLNLIVHNPQLAYTVLESLVRENQSGLGRNFKITREDVIAAFKDKGLPLSPFKTEKEITENFRQASRIGRSNISREIGGVKIERKETARILKIFDKGVGKKIVLTGSPGCGKSWILLELTDILESKSEFGILYIRGDQFDDIETDLQLRQRLGFEDDIVQLAARLSSFRKTVVILDSLDALALARDQKALKIFLNLIDRLTSVNDISIIAACRTFDLNYDPLLRDRKWDETIEVGNLDFEQNVEPILKKWNVDPRNIPQEQRNLLTIPRNLKLFERFADNVRIESLTSSYKFSDTFINKIVVENTKLGDNALNALTDMAVKLTKQRRLQLFRDNFNNKHLLKPLESEGIIRNISDIKIEFSHQTLIDALSTRNAIANDQTLECFILSHPPLPFIRPLVRSFLFYLRTYEIKRFPIQVIKVFDNPAIAYHIKRLIAESLSEITPAPEDLKFFERIFREHTDLFRRFLQVIKWEKWFDFFEENIFKSIMTEHSLKDLKLFFMFNLRKFMDTRPKQAIQYCNAMIQENPDIAYQIAFRIEDFKYWETEGVYELLVSLAKKTNEHIIKALGKYIETLNKGDKLLWKIITSNITEESKVDSFSLDSQQGGLICDTHNFHKEDFLKTRMCQSDYLISTAIHAIEQWSGKLYDFKQTYRDNFLRSTSWQRIHSKADMHSYGPFHFLLDEILSAIQERSKNNDKWWQENKKVLSNCKEAAIIYFLIQGYRANIEDNISDISSFLIEQKNLLYSRFNDEIGKLINQAFPYLAQQSQDDLQNIILNLKSPYDSEKDEIPRWLIELKYKYLCNIPIFLRFIETNQFIEKYSNEFGEYPQPPYVYSWGGFIGSPVSSEQMLSFSDDTIIKLFKHYSQSHRDWYEREHSIGGSESVSSAFRESCTSDPVRFIPFFDIILSEEINNAYAASIMEGLAQHISYRFGNYSPAKGWKPKEPVPDGITLAKTILKWLRIHEFLWKNQHETARAIQACCWIIEEPSDVEWLIFCLFRLAKHDNPDEIEQVILSKDKKEIIAEDLSHIALNSIRGIAAESAILLASRLLENDKELPELLFPLMLRFATDPHPGVRVSILDRLPYYAQDDLEGAWKLFHAMFKKPHPLLWKLAYDFLYYQYYKQFERVKYYLERMKNEAIETAAKNYGRISTLVYLSDYIAEKDLFEDFTRLNNEGVWLGAVQVFQANISGSENKEKCEKGFLHIINHITPTQSYLRNISHIFEKLEINDTTQEIADRFISVYIESKKEDSFYLHYFFDWLSKLSNHKHLSAIQICENLLFNIKENQIRSVFALDKEFICSAMNILREADLQNDPDLISRAIALQDQLLKFDFDNISKALDEAARE